MEHKYYSLRLALKQNGLWTCEHRPIPVSPEEFLKTFDNYISSNSYSINRCMETLVLFQVWNVSSFMSPLTQTVNENELYIVSFLDSIDEVRKRIQAYFIAFSENK